MISRTKFYKLYESLNSLTDVYGQLVEIAKTFEQELGVEDVATTGLLEAIAKVNELILRYNPSAGELDGSSQTVQDLQDFSDAQPMAQTQSQPLAQTQTQTQTQGQPLAQTQSQPLAQGQPQSQSQFQKQVQNQL